jgi:hypothetical protein
MKTRKRWLCVLATVLGCTAPAIGFANVESTEKAAEESPILQAAVSRWEDPAPPQTVPAVPAPNNAVVSPCGNGGCCESCCAPGFQWIVGVEGTFFWPQFNRTFLRNTLSNDLGNETLVSNTSNGGAEGTLLAAPRITFGLQGERWGLVGRYWYASNWNSAFAPSLPGSANFGVLGFDGFRAYTADLELQRRFCCCNWDLYGFGGLRYASINNDRSLVTTNSFNGPVLSASSFAGQQFNGTGITFGLLGMRPIWCDDSPVKLFFANRYSFLWGHGADAVQTTATSIDSVDSLTSTNGAAAKGNGDLFIAELQLGLQWDACLQCLPGRVFVRTALEYQYWDANTGVNAFSTSFVNVPANETGATATASAGNMLFNLIGFNIGAGIMY